MFTYYNIVQINGNSGSGKSLFFSDFQALQRVSKDYQNCLLINEYTQDRVEKLFSNHVYDVVVIDNADLIITRELDFHISDEVLAHKPTLWVILGRRSFYCVPCNACISPMESIELPTTDTSAAPQWLFRTTYRSFIPDSECFPEGTTKS